MSHPVVGRAILGFANTAALVLRERLDVANSAAIALCSQAEQLKRGGNSPVWIDFQRGRVISGASEPGFREYDRNLFPFIERLELLLAQLEVVYKFAIATEEALLVTQEAGSLSELLANRLGAAEGSERIGRGVVEGLTQMGVELPVIYAPIGLKATFVRREKREAIRVIQLIREEISVTSGLPYYFLFGNHHGSSFVNQQADPRLEIGCLELVAKWQALIEGEGYDTGCLPV